MMRALYSGVAGLRTHQTKMDVIGNNIANVNTVAFKATQTTFSDVMYQNLRGASGPTDTLGGVNAKQIGLGSLTAATKNTIESTGASQDTGEAFDIRLSDGQSTNFFIVDDGSGQKLFTRSGSFYIDGGGSLAMTSTGYLVQGWQAVTDPDSGETYINKDTVSPLRLNTPANQTSEPEWTQEGYVSGILDKTSTDINSDAGYNMSFGFYDNKGNLYTAKFAVKTFDTEGETYTIGLKSILDQNNNDILKWYVNDQIKTGYPNTYESFTDAERETLEDNIIATIFGSTNDLGQATGSAKNTYGLTNKYSLDENNNISVSQKASREVTPAVYDDDNNLVTPASTTKVSVSYTVDPYKINEDPASYIQIGDDGKYHVLGLTTSENVSPKVLGVTSPYDSDGNVLAAYQDDNGNLDQAKWRAAVSTAPTVESVFGANSQKITDLLGGTDKISTDTVAINSKTGALEVTYKDSTYRIDFDESDGSFSYVGDDGDEGNTKVFFNMSLLSAIASNGDAYDVAFDDIELDFSKMVSYYNGASSNAGMDRGNVDEPTVHAGKAVGKLTGLAVQQNGEIYGSYSNGNTMLLGQIAVAQFANASGLEALGSNLFSETLNSGHFDGIGVEITADGGKMNTGSLEMSNVDLSREFTEMITTQRGFQANSRIITVSDTLLEELTNLKR